VCVDDNMLNSGILDGSICSTLRML
jgi:hypothetical protein